MLNVFSNSIFSSRLLAPAFRWISPLTDGDAEDYHPRNGVPSPTFSYSFVYISDDEGKTWKRSLSELFISVNRAAWGLEEPIVVELRDGRLLMHLRSGMGRMYKSYLLGRRVFLDPAGARRWPDRFPTL